MKFIKENMNFDFVEFLSFKERPFRAKLSPAKIYHDMDKLKNNTKAFRDYFKKFRTKLIFKPEPKKEDGFVAIAGEAEWEHDNPTCGIIIYTDHYDTFKFSRYAWMQFKYVFISILLHEMIHFMQFVNRGNEESGMARYTKTGNDKVDERRRYYADKDEIQCHAFQAWLDFKVNRTKKSIPELVKSCCKRNYSNHLGTILKLFDYDFDNSALRQICKEIIRWDDRYYNYMIAKEI